MDFARNAAHTTVGAVASVGNTANVASHGMQEANATMATGVNSFDQNAQAANATMATGVNSFDQNAQVTNETLATGMNLANETAARTAKEVNRQAQEANATLSSGIDSINHQAEVMNATVSETTGIINDAISEFSPSIMLFLGILGPFQALMAVKICIDILKTLGVIKSAHVPTGLVDFQVAMEDHTEAYREVETPNIVQNITKSSVQFNVSTKEVTALLLLQKPFDSIPEMFKAVFVWNYALAAHNKSGSQQFRTKHSEIYFLDPESPPTQLPHMEFTEHYQNIRIICHSQSKRSLKFSSVRIHKGCSVRFEHLTVCHSRIYVAHGGSAHLHMCNIGSEPPQMDSPPVPTTMWDQSNSSEGVTFEGCSLSPNKGKMKKNNSSLQNLINGRRSPLYESGMAINYTNDNGTQDGYVFSVHQDDAMDPDYIVLLQDGSEMLAKKSHLTLRVEESAFTRAVSMMHEMFSYKGKVYDENETLILKIGMDSIKEATRGEKIGEVVYKNRNSDWIIAGRGRSLFRRHDDAKYLIKSKGKAEKGKAARRAEIFHGDLLIGEVIGDLRVAFICLEKKVVAKVNAIDSMKRRIEIVGGIDVAFMVMIVHSLAYKWA